MRVSSFIIAIVVVGGMGAPVRADDVAAASKAFAQAQEVMLTGDVARAADLFELADELAPSASALRNATRARYQIQNFATAATHAAELLRRYPSDQESRAVAEAILTKLAKELGQIDVACSSACTLEVDGKAIGSRPRDAFSFFTQPGERTVVATFEDGRKATDRITALVNHTTSVKIEAPPKPVAPPPKAEETHPAVPAAPVTMRTSGHGLSRGWFLGGAVVTLGAGTAAALFGMQTLATRDDIRDAVASGAQTDATDLYNRGRSQQLRTNICLGATAAAGIATIVLAVFTNWSGERNVVLSPSSNGGSLVYRSTF